MLRKEGDQGRRIWYLVRHLCSGERDGIWFEANFRRTYGFQTPIGFCIACQVLAKCIYGNGPLFRSREHGRSNLFHGLSDGHQNNYSIRLRMRGG